MRVLGVARVSTAEQAKDTHFSLGAQEQAIRAYCATRGWEIVDIFAYVKSGGSNRKELEAILDRVRADAIDVVVVNELDRLARDMISTLLFLEELKAAGARFASVADALDLTTPEGELHMHILAVFAAYFRKQLSRKVKMGQAQRAAQGKRHGVRPFGYQPDGGTWAIDPIEAPVVRQVYAWYLDEGSGFRAIAQRLNQQAVPGQQGVPGRWDARTIERMLRREAYAGDLIYGKWIQVRGRDGQTHLARQTPTLQRDTHPAIIPRDRWEATQRRLTARKTLGHAPTHGPYLLSGLVRCGVCGASMVVVTRTHGRPGQRTRMPHYLCRAYHTQGLCSTASRIAVADLEAAVVAALEQERAAVALDLTMARARRWMAGDPAVAEGADRQRQAQRRLAQTQAMLERAEAAMLAGAYTIAQYQAAVARIERDRQAAQGVLALPVALPDPDVVAERLDGLIALFQEARMAPDHAPYRTALPEWLRQIRCFPDRRVEVVWQESPD